MHGKSVSRILYILSQFLVGEEEGRLHLNISRESGVSRTAYIHVPKWSLILLYFEGTFAICKNKADTLRCSTHSTEHTMQAHYQLHVHVQHDHNGLSPFGCIVHFGRIICYMRTLQYWTQSSLSVVCIVRVQEESIELYFNHIMEAVYSVVGGSRQWLLFESVILYTCTCISDSAVSMCPPPLLLITEHKSNRSYTQNSKINCTTHY